MKKEYIFIILIAIILYLSYLILSFLYKEYKINEYIEYMESFRVDIEEQIDQSKKIIRYKTSKPFKNKVLKEQQSFKNKGDTLHSFTNEDQYNKYTKPLSDLEQEAEVIQEIEEDEIYDMSIYERWMYFLFNKNS